MSTEVKEEKLRGLEINYLIETNKNSRQAVYDYFKYEGGWGDIPIEDCSDMAWFIDGTEITFFDKDATQSVYEKYSNEDCYTLESKENGILRREDAIAFIACNDEEWHDPNFYIFSTANQYEWVTDAEGEDVLVPVINKEGK